MATLGESLLIMAMKLR